MTDLEQQLDKVLRAFENWSTKMGFENELKLNRQETKAALIALIEQRELAARIAERKAVALDNYHGHTFSDSTNWKGKFDKFVRNNEKRLEQLKADQQRSGGKV